MGVAQRQGNNRTRHQQKGSKTALAKVGEDKLGDDRHGRIQ